MKLTPAILYLALAAAAMAQQRDQVVQLNPFEVQADSDKSYGALNSNSITAFNTPLDRIPISADIYDAAFMADTASTSVEQMIETYSAGAGTKSSDGSYQPGDRGGGVNLRGLPTATMVRDSFMQIGAYGNPGSTGNGVTSNFDVERVEIINGPQALLYGGGGAGGVINVVSKQARLGRPEFGSLTYQIDQYGSKLAQADVGAGNDRIAVRAVVLDQKVGGRRVNIGGPLDGYYVQVAAKPFGDTTIRVTAEQTTLDRINNNNTKQTLTAASTSNDARNSQQLSYLLATNQVQAAANGAASGAGPIVNGLINWSNIDSFGGWWQSELTVNEFVELSAESKWNEWLSTKIDAGYNDYYDDWPHPGITLYAPNNATNPLGVWAAGTIPVDSEEPGRTKALRFTALATNDFFGGKAHSQSILGIDFSRHNDEAGKVDYSYYQADSNWNLIVNPTPGAANNGRTQIGRLFWPISTGPIMYPMFQPRANRITYNGQNYLREIENTINPGFISPSNPLGATLVSSNDYSQTTTVSRGVFGVNDTSWLDGKLDTLAGFRLGKYYDRVLGAGTLIANPTGGAPTVTGATQLVTATAYGFNFGANYAVRPWLHPYVSVSDSYNPPATLTTDPLGKITPIAHSLGEEVGVKVQNASGTISGSLAVFHVASHNEEFQVTTTLVNDINPSGLNGTFGTPSQWIVVDKVAQGVQAVLTAAPSPALRLRLSAAAVNGKINTNTSYDQVYNDQFFTNAQGQVTYSDGSVVFVPATFNSKQLTVTSTTAGAVPLTVTMLSTPSNPYYASPQQVNGQIQASSAGGTVLKQGVSPGTGFSMLTGRTGLAMSQEQLNYALNPGLVVPGSIVTSQAGQFTTGYPEFSLNGTGVYTVPSGWAKGFQLGGTALLGWKVRSYYYYPTGFSVGATQSLYWAPPISRFDLIAGYSRKLGGAVWRVQMNVTNVFNHYSIILLANTITGFAGPDGATFSQQPRMYQLTTSVSF